MLNWAEVQKINSKVQEARPQTSSISSNTVRTALYPAWSRSVADYLQKSVKGEKHTHTHSLNTLT